ncbi:MAG: general secretion pathway protein GspB [Pseudomonadota bacterium]
MSYILDALKKADAEREREASAVPDLHAQGDAARSERRSTHAGVWTLVATIATVIALGLLGWRWFAAPPADGAPPPALAQAPSQMPATPPAPLPSPVPAPAPAQSVRPAPSAMPSTAPPAAPAAVGRVKPIDPPPRTAPAAPVAPPVPPRTAAAPPTAATPVASAASGAGEGRLPTLAELPAELRGQLPALSVGGSVYSPRASSRIVILNGQVFREGDKPIEGLTVEQIRLKSTVLAFRGVRFELKH